MELVLVPVVVLVVMYATWRSIAAGVAAAAALAALAVPALGRPELVTAAGGAGSGILLGLIGRGARGGMRALLLGAIPLATGLVVRSLVWERQLLRARLAELVDAQAGDRLPAAARGELADILLGLAPSSEALFGFAVTLACYGLARRLFPRLGVEMVPLGHLARLRLPFAIVWSFALALLLVILGSMIEERWLLFTGLNLAVVHGAAFFVEGLAVGRYAASAQAVPGIVQLGLALLAVLVPPLPLVVAGIGLFDLWFDFRRLLAPPASGAGPVGGGG